LQQASHKRDAEAITLLPDLEVGATGSLTGGATPDPPQPKDQFVLKFAKP
jgi:hypothetical protein